MELNETWAYRLPGVSLEAVDTALALAEVTPEGLSEEAGVVTAWFAARADLPPLRGLPPGRWEAVAPEDWAQRWKADITPIEVGRIRIVPPWLADPADLAAATTLVIEPGMAFGTGHHETTTGCLRALQALDLTGRRVVDVGTGTGVLALAAEALGASEVDAVDIDPEAIAVAEENVRRHGARRVRLTVGSCEVVDGPGDVVVANMITPVLLDLADRLVDLVLPGGALVLSGVAVERGEHVRAAYAARGVALAAETGREWTVLRGRRQETPRQHDAHGPTEARP